MNVSIASAKFTKDLIRQHAFRVKKSLGQNFLVDMHVLDKIVLAANISIDDLVIEIGPGLGALTQALCRAAKLVTAIELDKQLTQILCESLAEFSNVEIINADILKVDISELIHTRGYQRAVVVANLPYYITTPVIMQLLEGGAPLTEIIVMVQKEVAMRIMAMPGSKDYGALSLGVTYRAKVDYIANVPRNCFIPRPGVDSAVIRLTPHALPPVDVTDEELFFAVIKAAFANRRKTLVNCLHHGGLVEDKSQAATALSTCGLDINIRGEELGLNEYSKLTATLLDICRDL